MSLIRRLPSGGRGASFGTSRAGKKYGTEYHTVLKSGNIKFVIQNDTVASTKSPMETMTKNRVYVTVNQNNKLKYITYYDSDNKRKKQIDLDGIPHRLHGKKELPHTHLGYEHDENGTRRLTTKEHKMVENVINLWNNYLSGK